MQDPRTREGSDRSPQEESRRRFINAFSRRAAALQTEERNRCQARADAEGTHIDRGFHRRKPADCEREPAIAAGRQHEDTHARLDTRTAALRAQEVLDPLAKQSVRRTGDRSITPLRTWSQVLTLA